jgi:hypothetical protein
MARGEHVRERVQLGDGPGDHHHVGRRQRRVAGRHRLDRLRLRRQAVREWDPEVREQARLLVEHRLELEVDRQRARVEQQSCDLLALVHVDRRRAGGIGGAHCTSSQTR